MTQGFIVVVVGIGLIYLVLSGKLDCVIASFRACYSGNAPESAVKSATKTPVSSSQEIIGKVMSPQVAL